jgi:hypothetical protein
LKKVSKTDKSDPKRLKKDLPRLVRSLSSEDRVILIGASRCPWECEQKVSKETILFFIAVIMHKFCGEVIQILMAILH